jgi:ParB-like nuclease family protein
MGQYVPLSSIRTNRALDPDDDVGKLAEHINDSGLQVPILVTSDYTLIDGLRRLKAVASLGHTTVEVVAVNMYEQAMAWIKRAREHGVEARPLAPRRIAELYAACRPLMNMSRSLKMRGVQFGTGVQVLGRKSFLEAAGIDSEAYLQATTQIYRIAEQDTEKGRWARQVLPKVEAGTMTVYMALDYIRRRADKGNVVKLEEQRLIVMNTRATLTGLLYSLRQLGPLDPELNRDGEGLIDDLRKMRRVLHQLINQLTKEQKQ